MDGAECQEWGPRQSCARVKAGGALHRDDECQDWIRALVEAVSFGVLGLEKYIPQRVSYYSQTILIRDTAHAHFGCLQHV